MLCNFVAYNESAFELLEDIRQSQFSATLSELEKTMIYKYTNKKNVKAL